MALKDLKETTGFRPPIIIIHGDPGVGKSTFGAKANKPIMLNCNDGLDGITCVKYEPRPSDPINPTLIRTFKELMGAIKDLYKEDHDFKTVVLDCLSDAEQMIWKQICAEKNLRAMEDLSYSKAYQFAMTYWIDLMEGLSLLRDHRKMSVIILAHTKIQQFNNPMTASYDRYIIDVHKYALGLLYKWTDAILYASYRMSQTEKDVGFGKKVTKVKTGQRVLYTTYGGSYMAKNRYGLPDTIPLNYTDFINAVSNSSTSNYEDKITMEEQEAADLQEVMGADGAAPLENIHAMIAESATH